ncbi:hypothetical protein BTM25_10240 [Actinomadura rubteroloni]|uniref:Phage resistance protein n=1 Tax=Actinomadura rubteroloni TaxID=1926885 RepID=A0A2P4UNL6_9ACTN|nr:DUF6079 family protein [Actinomadura rubteroloni]POM26622.1 hypothetical protein BTM25_10240 [Actinomadura rubteroloni]
MAEPPLLHDVIDIKETISTSDYVLKLADAVTPEGAERALADYVITDRLVDNFDQALGLIKAALDGGSSKAAYLHGSFGSGKSHFMAVLFALLSNNPSAVRREEFDRLLVRHDWLTEDGRKFLLVPYHMLGAKTMEQRVLGGYVKHIRRLHSDDVPLPAVYRTDGLFADLRAMRERFGDDAVIGGLTDDTGEDDEWGDSFAWTPEKLDIAMSAPEHYADVDGVESLDLTHPTAPHELRAKLVQDAGTTLFPGFTRSAAEDEGGFISLDAGLTVIAEHAKSLGYDGIVLFLDELILWLTTLINDEKRATLEAGKITNFVEGGDAHRAIPIVSFIARQRDLRELVGEKMSGAAETSIQDTLNLASGRFDKITLEDRNLPQVAHSRLLRPKDDAARKLIDEAFRKTKRQGARVWDMLLGSDEIVTGADEDAFRLTYPFSPAFMDTLVHLSAALQRNRTALKLMGELLAKHRDRLRLGDLVPLGDLYAEIAQGGDRPFVDSQKVIFDNADKLYRTKLRPYLLNSNDVTEEDVERYLRRPEDVADATLAGRCRAFVTDDRLVCTLLLSALTPGVPTLNDLTVRRLGALNHGIVTSPIPNAERNIIGTKIGTWAAQFPEIKVGGSDAMPTVRLELDGVDVNGVIANSEVNDNIGNRRSLIRRLLAAELGVSREDGRMGADELSFVWRGTERTVEIVFGNVADREELPDHDMQPSLPGQWRIIVDLPYDEGELGPREDADRMRDLRERQGEPTRTLAWLPTHLSAQRYADFRRLVKIDKALEDDQRFHHHYAAHLNADDRARAKGMLEGQREALLKQVRAAFRQAYGLAQKQPADVDPSFSDHLVALPDLGDLPLSIGQPLDKALRDVAGRLLAHQFPAHPDLDPNGTGVAVKPAEARTVLAHVRAAAEAKDGRAEIPPKDRKIMDRLVAPLELGEQMEVYFRLSHRWADHFRRLARRDGVTGDHTVAALRGWLDEPEPRGLPGFLADLVIAAFAETDDRVWVRAGAPLEPPPDLGRVQNADALRDQPLPAEDVWDAARERYEEIFGAKAPVLRRGRIVNHFADTVVEAVRRYRTSAEDLVRRLEEHAGFLGLDDAEDGRLAIARRALDLLHEVQATRERGGSAKRVVEVFGGFDLGPVEPERYGTSVKRAAHVTQALVLAPWDTLDLARGLGAEGHELLERLRRAARADERTVPLADELRGIPTQINVLIKRNQSRRPAPPPPPSAPPAPTVSAPLVPSASVPLVPPAGASPVSTGTAGAVSGAAGARRGRRRSGGGRTTAARAAAELSAELAGLEPGATVEIAWRVVE